MKHIEINIWKACNNNCIFCMSWITKNKILWFEKIETLKNEIVNLEKNGYKSIWFLWWEPTIHPNFLEIVNFAKINWFKNIEVVSNWTKFDDKKYLSEAIKSWLTRISISIHSIDWKEEELLTGGIWGILDKKINAINNIITEIKKWLLQKELSVNIIVSKINYKWIKKLILFLYKLWVKSFRLNFIQLEWNSTNNYEILALKYEEFNKYLNEIINLNDIYKDMRINFEAIPWCFSWLNYEKYLKYSEQMIDKEKDKISRNDIDLVSREIINQLDRRKELKWYIKKCKNCFLKWDCEWIWIRYINFFKLK